MSSQSDLGGMEADVLPPLANFQVTEPQLKNQEGPRQTEQGQQQQPEREQGFSLMVLGYEGLSASGTKELSN